MTEKDRKKTEEKIFFSKDEIAEALSQYIAGESGIGEKITPEEAGKRGAFLADIKETGKKYLNDEISFEEAIEEVIKQIISFVISVAGKLTDITVEVVSKYVIAIAPVIGSILNFAKEHIKKWLRKVVEEKLKEAAKKIWTKAKNSVSGETVRIHPNAKKLWTKAKNWVKKKREEN